MMIVHTILYRHYSIYFICTSTRCTGWSFEWAH